MENIYGNAAPQAAAGWPWQPRRMRNKSNSRFVTMPVSDLCCPLYMTACVHVCVYIDTYMCVGVSDIQLNKRQRAVCRCANKKKNVTSSGRYEHDEKAQSCHTMPKVAYIHTYVYSYHLQRV